MKKLILIGGLALLCFVACKKDDDPNPPVPLPAVPSGQYRLEKKEFRNSNHQLVEIITQPIDTTLYFFYKPSGQFKKVVTIDSTSECIDNWPEFMDEFIEPTTYDSTQFFPTVDGIILHFYLGWQGPDDREYLLYYLTKSDYLPADTIPCN